MEMRMESEAGPAREQDELQDNLRRGRPAAGHDPVKRKQILEGARRVFIEMGFDAASMNDITRAAGVSKGTIYVYFANKEELFEAIIDDERGSIFSNMHEALRQDEDIRAAMINFGKALSTKITCDKVVRAQRTVIGVSERMPELGRRFYERGPLQGHGQFVIFLEKGVARGLLDIPDTNLAAYQFVDLAMAGLFRQCIFAYRLEAPSTEEVDYVVAAGVDMFLKSYGTEKLREGTSNGIAAR